MNSRLSVRLDAYRAAVAASRASLATCPQHECARATCGCGIPLGARPLDKEIHAAVALAHEVMFLDDRGLL